MTTMTNVITNKNDSLTDFERDIRSIFFQSLRDWDEAFNNFKKGAESAETEEKFKNNEKKFRKFTFNERNSIFSRVYSVIKLTVHEFRQANERIDQKNKKLEKIYHEVLNDIAKKAEKKRLKEEMN